MIAITDHCLCRRLNFKGLLLTWLFMKNSPLLSSSMILLLDLAGRLFFIINELAAGRRQHVPPERRRRRCELTGDGAWSVVAASIWRERIYRQKNVPATAEYMSQLSRNVCCFFHFLGGN